MSDPFFALPRATKAPVFFEQILPGLALRLPPVTLPDRVVYHVHGAGVWSVGLEAGRLVVTAGVHGPIGMQLSMTEAHFREGLTGALRERHLAVLKKWGRPAELADFSRLRPNVARLRAAIAVGGSLAFVLDDREYADRYRYVLTVGPGPAAWQTADVTIEVDLDDLAALAAARTPPMKVLVSGKLRLAGDVALPGRLLGALLA